MKLFSKKKNNRPASVAEPVIQMNAGTIAAKAKELDLKTKKLSTQLFSGENRSSFRGRGMSFKEVRQYQMGDDVRFIDWNVSARLGHTYSKVFEEERELNIFLMVDVSASNLFGTYVQTKQEQIANICSVLAFAALQGNNKAGAMFFSDKIEKILPSRKSKDHVFYLVKQLLSLKAQSAKTDIAKALQALNNITRQRSVVFLVSDFADEGYKEALQIAAARHDVIGIQVYDHSERRLPSIGLVQLKDAETGELRWMDTSDGISRRLYQQQFDNRMLKTQDVFRECGADLLQVSTDADYLKVLKAFFIRRH